jgi:hypothetical protein
MQQRPKSGKRVFICCKGATSINILLLILSLTLILLLSRCVFSLLTNTERHSFQQLRILNQEIFFCLLQSDYSQYKYAYEYRLRLAKNNCYAQKKSKQTFYALMLGYAQLRRQVSDHHTFALCCRELRQIEHAIDQLCVAAKKQQAIDTSTFARAIANFEEIFQSVLMVSAPEPLVFLLFIFYLQALREQFDALIFS